MFEIVTEIVQCKSFHYMLFALHNEYKDFYLFIFFFADGTPRERTKQHSS